ncbi:MAG: hypothetical protein J3Q66DRAFT_368737 [Benniella sp.]|nr:MAG: hypothetical protein J3Q66DRAFT_368737 [Benniella sp.]
MSLLRLREFLRLPSSCPTCRHPARASRRDKCDPTSTASSSSPAEGTTAGPEGEVYGPFACAPHASWSSASARSALRIQRHQQRPPPPPPPQQQQQLLLLLQHQNQQQLQQGQDPQQQQQNPQQQQQQHQQQQ